MIWPIRGVMRRVVSSPGMAYLHDDDMHHLDETLGDEFEREFFRAMSESLDDK